MKANRSIVACFVLTCCALASETSARAQGNNTEKPSAALAPSKRLTIEVTGGDNNVAIGDASVYFKYQQSRALRKDKKYALNVKTNRDGTAHIPDVPLGSVLIQVVADGWKPYGHEYEITDQATTIKIHLDRPPKWY